MIKSVIKKLKSYIFVEWNVCKFTTLKQIPFIGFVILKEKISHFNKR